MREVCSPNSEKPNSPENHKSLEKTCPDSWHARIKVKNLEDTKYCLAGLPDVSSLDKRIDALKKNGANSGSQTQEIKLLQGFVNSSTTGGLENGEVKKVGGCPDVAVTFKVRGGYLSLDIPFDRFPYVLDRINLERRDCKQNSECEDLALPDLRSHFLPGPVTITDLKQGDYRIQGDHLKAVQEIQLSRGGSAVPYTPTVGVNNVDFTVKNKLDPGTYNVFFVIQKIPIPATYVDEHNKLQQLILVIPAKETKSPADGSTKNNKTSAKAESTNPADAKKENGTPPAQSAPPAKKDESKKDESKKNDGAPAPTIANIDPANPTAATPALTITGQNFMPNAVATLVDSTGTEIQSPTTRTSDTQMQVQATLSQGNQWRIKIQNPGNDQVAERLFNVA